MDVELIKTVARLKSCTKEEFQEYLVKYPEKHYTSLCVLDNDLILMYFVIKDTTLINIGQAHLKNNKFLMIKD